MKHLKIPLALFVSIAFFSSCLLPGNKSAADYQTKIVTGSTNNNIEILDFGGTGKPILFLPGLGNSAHVFVDFAPKFSKDFHVYAMSRRGYGASEQTANGYHSDTLANDILAVTKALNLDKVILIGHSIAGDEISNFASSYPGKVNKIIYLDAAYDRTTLMTRLMPFMPAIPNPTAKDSSSMVNLASFSAKTIGVTMPDDELKSTYIFSEDGKYQKDVTPGEIAGKMMSGIERPDYKNISCPALSIYAVANSVKEIFPFYNSLDAENKRKADTCFTIFKKFGKEQMAVFKSEVKQGIVKEIRGANHYVFISNPVETENHIRDFLQ